MTEYKTEDGRLFASAENAVAHYLHVMTKTQKFLEDLSALCQEHEDLNPETKKALSLAIGTETTESLFPAMRECLRAAEAIE